MDLVHDIASIVAEKDRIIAEEDRISNLPDDIIHHILSFVDMKDVIRTGKISRRWKHIWTTIPRLDLDTSEFPHLPQFAKFMKHTLSRRNNSASLSTVNLTFTGAATQFAVQSIIKYAISHNVKQLTMRWDAKKSLEFPRCLFVSSHTLKILTLTGMSARCFVLASGWDFPSLETLNLTNIKFLGGADETSTPFPIINLVAPQLQNLTVTPINSPYSMLQLLTEGFSSLEKVELSLLSYPYRENDVPLLLDMFHMFCSATVLILDKHIIEAISLCLDKLSPEPCPFKNLKCLKVHGVSCYPTRAKNYLLENSPSATFIMDSPQVPQKRSREVVPNDGMANKVAKLEAKNKQAETVDKEKRTLKAKIPTQGEVIAELHSKTQILETTKCQHEKLMPHIMNGKMAELKLQVESGNPDYEVIRSMGCEIKSLIDLIPKCSREAVEAHFSTRYREVKHWSHTYINARQWEMIETQLGYLTDSERVYSNNIQIRSDVLTSDQTPSSTNVTTSSKEGAK